MLLKSRNTMVASAIVFLGVVILLRFTGIVVEDNIARIAGSVFAGNAESIPLIELQSINTAWFDPSVWSMDTVTQAINTWLHDVIDSVLPAVIYTLNASVIHFAIITRVEWVGALSTVAKAAPMAAA